MMVGGERERERQKGRKREELQHIKLETTHE